LQSDDKILVNMGALVRLSPTGAYDASFHPDFSQNNGRASLMLVQPDDKILVAGNFDAVNGVKRHYLARLNADGTLDTSFDPGSGPDSIIYDLALAPDGDVIVVGAFTSFNGVPKPGIVRLYGGAGPRLTDAGRSAGTFRFQLQTRSGQVYLPEAKDSLGPGDWKPLTSFTGNGQPHEIIDLAGTNGYRIYRIEVQSQ
jgi:uncharacterized delta-60 repeat protein